RRPAFGGFGCIARAVKAQSAPRPWSSAAYMGFGWCLVSVHSCFLCITDCTGFMASFARLRGIIRGGSTLWWDEGNPAQAELERDTPSPQEKIPMKPVAVRSGDRNCDWRPAPRARASAARYPLRTAPSMVAGQPVAV